MTRDEHKNIVTQLLGMVAPEHQAAASEHLTSLTEDYETTLASLETANTSVSTLTQNNEKLRAVNADLFLKVGTTKQSAHETKTPEQDEPTTKRDFADLFNEKGELK